MGDFGEGMYNRQSLDASLIKHASRLVLSSVYNYQVHRLAKTIGRFFDKIMQRLFFLIAKSLIL